MDYKSILKTKVSCGYRKLIPIPNDEFKNHYSSLTDYIDSVLGYDMEGLRSVDKAIERLHLGAVYTLVNDHYGTVLPVINKKGAIVGGSVQYFDALTGNVMYKDLLVNHLYNWFCYDYLVDPNVFFGEHLLSGRNVAIVQDEKTAVLGMIAEPSIDWLAIGLGRNLTKVMAEKLNGLRVVMFADSISVDAWNKDFGERFLVNDSFVESDINAYLIDCYKNKHPPK